jgi:hypothetical protein
VCACQRKKKSKEEIIKMKGSLEKFCSKEFEEGGFHVGIMVMMGKLHFLLY